ncbi:TPR REGION domain-containing protein [Citrus sinensis]|uniref:TPR REGION domain-containing protein n=1 Tax=Citrus sinensis TaxID=2711 RepID=A0ACB8J1W6_CITSI|nr:TPR REGION domain-containing protein [Citrus sinensis]
MAEEEGSQTVAEQTAQPTETVGTTQASVEATMESVTVSGTESTCNNNCETSGAIADGEREKTVEFADELMEKGTNALKESDYGEAAECFSRALEIRVSHYGELALECVNAYYQYGRALLYKAQEEADPLVSVPKKEGDSQQGSDKDDSVKNAVNGESSTASVSSSAEQHGSSNNQDEAADDVPGDNEEDEEGNDGENVAEADEDESDLDLAWKMLDVARAIAEKHWGDSMEKVDILSALAEVALEREDIETSLSDYQKALTILERMVEPDSRHIAELNFRICLCLEIGSKPQEAIPYCQKAISVCKSRVQRLLNEVKSLGESATSSAPAELDDGIQQSSNLQQVALFPKSILSEILGMASAKAKGDEKSSTSAVLSSSRMGTANSDGDFDSPTVSTAHTSGAAGVTHLGVVGRGVKRVSMSTGSAESRPSKKSTSDPSSDKGDGSVC